jgi:hypothetical protein
MPVFAAAEAGGVAVGVVYRGLTQGDVMVRKMIGVVVLLILVAGVLGCVSIQPLNAMP